VCLYVYPPIVARQRLGKNSSIVASQRLGRNVRPGRNIHAKICVVLFKTTFRRLDSASVLRQFSPSIFTIFQSFDSSWSELQTSSLHKLQLNENKENSADSKRPVGMSPEQGARRFPEASPCIDMRAGVGFQELSSVGHHSSTLSLH
jgi:hypothetical protein